MCRLVIAVIQGCESVATDAAVWWSKSANVVKCAVNSQQLVLLLNQPPQSNYVSQDVTKAREFFPGFCRFVP